MATNAFDHENRSTPRYLYVKLNGLSLFIATFLATAAVVTICILFLALLPQTTMAFFSFVLHADLSGIARPVDWESFMAAVLFWPLATGLYAALIARFYNRNNRFFRSQDS